MILVKYGKESHLESLASGSMRFMPLQYYRNYENTEEIKSGIADPLEGMMIERVDNLLIEDKNGVNLEEYKGSTMLGLDFGSIALVPVFCISAYKDLDEMHENMKAIKEKFPSYTHYLLINQANKFINDIHRCSKGLVSGLVKYKEISLQNHLIDSYECAFYKRPLFSYQNEYRFVSSNIKTRDRMFLSFTSNVSMEIISM